MLESAAVDAVAIFTQRWTHGPLVLAALNAGKHVYSAVPVAITTDEIRAIIDAVRSTGLTYMTGETSQYNPATVHARDRIAEGAFGRLFYAEGDYGHDMDLGFYDAYRYSGGEDSRTHAVSVSAIGVRDERGDGVFDRSVSRFDNGVSNATALFEVAGGDDPSLRHIAPELRAAFASGSAPVHDRSRLPRVFDGLHNGHEGSHHLGGRPLHPAGHRRARVGTAGWGPAGDPRLRGRPRGVRAQVPGLRP